MATKKYTPRQRIDKINAYNRDYNKAHYRAFGLQLNNETCADVIQKLDLLPNKTEYIVSLIRADIEKNGIGND